MSKSDKSAKDASDEPKKSSKLKPILGAVLLLGLGAGGTFAAFQLGYVGSPAGTQEPDTPKLVSKGEEDPYAPPGEQEKGAAPFVAGEGGSKYRTAYYSFEEGFTSNLKDSIGLVQLSLAVSTKHDGRILQWLDRHELALRSAILVELAATSEADVYSVEGKARLQKRLAEAINAVLEEQEGFGGVDTVHFKTFLVQ